MSERVLRATGNARKVRQELRRGTSPGGPSWGVARDLFETPGIWRTARRDFDQCARPTLRFTARVATGAHVRTLVKAGSRSLR